MPIFNLKRQNKNLNEYSLFVSSCESDFVCRRLLCDRRIASSSRRRQTVACEPIARRMNARKTTNIIYIRELTDNSTRTHFARKYHKNLFLKILHLSPLLHSFTWTTHRMHSNGQKWWWIVCVSYHIRIVKAEQDHRELMRNISFRFHSIRRQHNLP